MCGFIAQLVEHRTGIAEDKGSNPVEALVFSGFYFPIPEIGKLTAMIILHFKGAFVWDQSGIRITGIMRVSVCLGAILIPEYLDFHSGYSAPRSRISEIYSGIYSYSGISQTHAP